MRGWCGVILMLGLGCAPSVAPPVEAPEPAPRPELAQQVLASEPARLGWYSVFIAGERVCGTDERGIDWCWHAADLDAEPLAITDRHIQFTSCGIGPSSYSEIRFRPLRPPGCVSNFKGEVECSSSDSIQACSLHASGQVYCQYQGAVVRIEGVEPAAGLVMNDAAACTLSSEGRAWCWASGSSVGIELSVPADKPSAELKVSFDRETGLLEMSEPIFAPFRLRLHDRFNPLFGPYELGFGIPELTLTRANRA